MPRWVAELGLPGLVAVLAHAGMPDYVGALELVHRYEHVYLDTTMVGTPFNERAMPVPADRAASDDRLGVGFLRAVLHDTPDQLLGPLAV